MARSGFRLVRMRAPVIRPLTSVAIIMCYLAAIALASAMGVGRWVNAWQEQATLKMSLYISPLENDANINRQTKKITQITRMLEKNPAIQSAELISKNEMSKLLAPWLGNNVDLSNMPLPDLIDITLKPKATIDMPKLAKKIKAVLPDVKLENHQQWHDAIERWVLLIQILAGLVLLAALACMAAVISLAANASIDANRNVVNVFYLIGAEDSFIVSAFQLYFLQLGLVAGTLGALGAALTFFLAEQLWKFIPDSLSLSAVGASLAPMDYVALILIPALACLIAITASRRQTMIHLRELP